VAALNLFNHQKNNHKNSNHENSNREKSHREKLNEVPTDVDLSELERDSRYRVFSGGMSVFVTAVLVLFAVFQLYASLSGRLPQQIRNILTA